MLRRFYVGLFGILLLLMSAHPMFAQTWIGALNIVTTDTTATITWGTAVPADTQVKYGTTTSYGTRSTLNSALVTVHSATLTKLKANTQYHVRALAHDAAGILVTGPDYVFATQSGAIAVTVTPTSATVNSGGTQQFSAQVANTGNTSVTWTATAGTISGSGLFTAPTVTADKSVSVTATSVADTTKSASATVTVKAPGPALGVNPKGMSLSATQGGSNPSQVPVSITNTGGGTLSFTLSSDAAWLVAGPASGTAPASVQVGANITGLSVGTYTGHITVSAAGATGSPATITVTLSITAALPVAHSVALTWNASTSSDVVGYSAYRATVKGGPYGLVASAISGTAYTDQSVQSGATYYYVVTATNSSGQESVNSNEATAIVP